MRGNVNFSAQRARAFGRTNTIRIIGGDAAIRVSIVMWYARTRRLKLRVSLPAHNRDDATNPIAEAPPQNGVLQYFSSLDESLMERLQREFPNVRFVKAFNSVGNSRMVNPQFAGG